MNQYPSLFLTSNQINFPQVYLFIFPMTIISKQSPCFFPCFILSHELFLIIFSPNTLSNPIKEGDRAKVNPPKMLSTNHFVVNFWMYACMNNTYQVQLLVHFCRKKGLVLSGSQRDLTLHLNQVHSSLHTLQLEVL